MTLTEQKFENTFQHLGTSHDLDVQGTRNTEFSEHLQTFIWAKILTPRIYR